MSHDKSPHGVQAYAVNRIGHAAGRKLADGLWKLEWIRRLATKHPDLMRIVNEGAIALTSMLEVGGDSTLARLANFVAESLSMESLELLEKFEKDPENAELAAEAVKIGQDAGAKVDSDVVIAFGHIHKSKDCRFVAEYVADATPPARTGKDGKVFTNPSTARVISTTMSAALDAHTALCGYCYPALSVRKAEEKQEKPKEVVPGRNLIEYLMRYRAENATNHKFEMFWKTYLSRLDGPDGPELARKFQEAFNGKHSYEAFCFVADMPHRSPDTGREEWHHALDALLGQVTPPDSLKKKIEGFIDEEKRQTEEMFRALFAWLAKGNAARKEKILAKQASIAELDKAWKESREAKPGFWSARNIVIICLSVILASWYLIQRADNANTRSDTSEQKVETSNVR